jgi:Na+/melibiose symporter-like transporter
MPDDSPNDTLQKIWQNQPMEAPTMTLEMIRGKAREYRSRTRRELFASIAVVLIVVATSVFGILHGPGGGVRLLFSLAIFWVLAGQIFLHRGMWQPGLPVDATLSTGLEFYRRELEQQQDLIRRILRWTFGPVILSVGTLIVVLIEMARGWSKPISAIMPFTTLFVIWIILFFMLRSRNRRKIQREIEQLRNVETASQK